ncbi:MAG: single-stranded DNA-binding protein [Streptosporangiaceae bacterium]
MTFVVIEGNTTGDATLREFTGKTGQQVPISNASVAVNDRAYNSQSEQWEDTGREFYEVTVAGEEAAHFAASARKGTRLLITGALRTEEYTDSDGNTRQRRRINATGHGVSTRFAPAHTAGN